MSTHETPTGASVSWALELAGGDDGMLKDKPETVATWAISQAVLRREAIFIIQTAVGDWKKLMRMILIALYSTWHPAPFYS